MGKEIHSTRSQSIYKMLLYREGPEILCSENPSVHRFSCNSEAKCRSQLRPRGVRLTAWPPVHTPSETGTAHMRIQGHHPSPSEQSLPVGSGLDTDGKARLLLLGSQTPPLPLGSAAVPLAVAWYHRGDCKASPPRGRWETGGRECGPPSWGLCASQPPTLSSASPAALFLSACSTRAGGQGARLRSLLLSVGPKQPSLASI